MRNILITGGCGFVGSSLAMLLKKNYPQYDIICMDNLKRRGSELNIRRLGQYSIKFIHGDIRNKEDFDGIPAVSAIIDASAEPSVLAGIDSAPDYVLNTNLMGTINCLNFAAKHHADILFLSTSRVYPIQNLEQIAFDVGETRFKISQNQTVSGLTARGVSEELSTKGARSLYGTSKLASELLIDEYNYFYKLRTVINRCGILTGPWQMGKVDQGVVVLWLARHFWRQNLSYIGYGGEGLQVRDILHIEDLYRLIDFQLHNFEKLNGHTFNVGGGIDVSVSLKELTMICQELTGNRILINSITEDRKADVRIYITDNSKITSYTGWKPEITAPKILEDIYRWIRDNHSDLESILK